MTKRESPCAGLRRQPTSLQPCRGLRARRGRWGDVQGRRHEVGPVAREGARPGGEANGLGWQRLQWPSHAATPRAALEKKPTTS